MHDPDERPRLRWRRLAWGIAAAIVFPVLYVAMLGPISWFDRNHDRVHPWHHDYYATLRLLYEVPQIDGVLSRYEDWWGDLPPLRSWQRQRIVDSIAHLKEKLAHAEELIPLVEQHQARLKPLLDRVKELRESVAVDPGRQPELDDAWKAAHEEMQDGPSSKVGDPAVTKRFCRQELAEEEAALRRLYDR